MENYVALVLTTIIACLGIWNNNKQSEKNDLKPSGKILLFLTIVCAVATAIGIRNTLSDVSQGKKKQDILLATAETLTAQLTEIKTGFSRLEALAPAEEEIAEDQEQMDSESADSAPSSPPTPKAAAQNAYNLLGSDNPIDRKLGEQALMELPDLEEYLKLIREAP